MYFLRVIRRHKLKDIFSLLVYVYSLLDEEQIEDHHERNIKAALVKAHIETEDRLPLFLVIRNCDDKSTSAYEAKVKRIIDKVFQRLRGLSSAREKLKKFTSVYDKGGMTSVASLKPLLKQVTEDIFDPSKPDMVDITHKSTGFRDLLKSGFGLFMNVSKPRPNDHQLLVIFVIGGIKTQEVRVIKEAAAKANTQVIVGSTHFLDNDSLLYNLLGAENLNPYSVMGDHHDPSMELDDQSE